jgi:hypothetical protein
MTNGIIKGIIPVVIGGLIYLTYRTDSLIMFGWFKSIGLSDLVTFFRTNELLQNLVIPNWVIYSLPDALWLFSFTYLTILIWDFKISRQSIFWICLAPAVGLFSEIGQLIGVIPGTFDRVDLLLLFFAAILPFNHLIQLKTIKIKKL